MPGQAAADPLTTALCQADAVTLQDPAICLKRVATLQHTRVYSSPSMLLGSEPRLLIGAPTLLSAGAPGHPQTHDARPAGLEVWTSPESGSDERQSPTW